MKLHRDLDVTQKTAWHLAHRIRKGLNLTGMALFSGPVEADEAYLGGKRKHMPKAKPVDADGPEPWTAGPVHLVESVSRLRRVQLAVRRQWSWLPSARYRSAWPGCR